MQRWRVAALGRGGGSLVQEAGLGSGAAGALEDFDSGPVTVSSAFCEEFLPSPLQNQTFTEAAVNMAG